MPFAYDANGNLRGKIDLDGVEWRFSYDAWNRLVKAERDDGSGWITAAEHGYNALHWQVESTLDTDHDGDFDQTRRRTFDGSWRLVQEDVQDHAGTADWLVYRRISLYWGARYIDDAISRAIEHVDRSDTDSAEWTVDGHRRYHHITDTLYSTVAIVEDQGSGVPVVERVTYDAYGRPELWLPSDVLPSHHSPLPRLHLASPDEGSPAAGW